jgi:hypothetical protein
MMILQGISFLAYQKMEQYESNYPRETVRLSVKWFVMPGFFPPLFLPKMSPAAAMRVRLATLPSIA